MAIALRSLERIGKERAADSWTSDVPRQGWKFWVGMLGIPVENDSWGTDRAPVISWSIGCAMVLMTLTALALGGDVYTRLGWIPAEAFRYGGLTHLTGFLLHAGWLHLLGNLYFLLAFGDNVEDLLGHARYAALMVVATAVGDVGHWLVAPDPSVPAVGASGGISGVIACYAVLFPRAKLSLRILVLWLSMPAYALFAIWVLWQLFLAHLQSGDMTNVSAGAHLGGAFVGLWFGWTQRR